MSDGDAPIRPTTETNVLLGQLMAKVDAAADEQRTSRTEVSALRTEVSALASDVAVLKSQVKPATPWWSIAAGISSVVLVLGSVIGVVIYVVTH